MSYSICGNIYELISGFTYLSEKARYYREQKKLKAQKHNSESYINRKLSEKRDNFKYSESSEAIRQLNHRNKRKVEKANVAEEKKRRREYMKKIQSVEKIQ